MAGDRHQPSPPKHRRNSGDESEEASKRHKHRHRHHRRHRHRSNRNHEDDVRTKDVVEEKVQTPPPQPLPLLVPSSKGNWRSDHDVEEGEILEEDDDLVGVKKKVDSSDAESGEIKVAVANANHKMEAVQVELDASTVSYGGQNVEKVGCDSTISGVDIDAVDFSTSAAISIRGIINGDAKTPDEIDLQTSSSVEHNADVDISNVNTGKSLRSSSPEGLEKRKEYYIGESEVIGQNPLFDVNEANKHISVGSSVLPERSLEEVRSINRSRSSYKAKERSRSQSRSNFEDASPLQAQQLKDLKNTEIRHPKDFDDEIIIRYHNDYQHDSRNLDKGRERSFSYSRHTTRDDRYHSSDTRNRVRDKSRETWDRDRKRERDWEKVQERAREGDRNREKDREKERERKREKERERRERDKEILKDKDCDKFTPNHKYYDADGSYGDRGRHTDYRHRLLDETEDKDKARRNNTNKAQSSRIDHSERDAQKQRRDELEQENYQESIVLQFEDKEEEEIEKIKKESRKRRQAILDKFKTQQSQKKLEPESEIDEKPSLSVAETHGVQYKVTEMTLVETSSSVGKSPEQIVPPAIKTHVSGALGKGTPKSEGSADMFHDDIFGDSPAGVRKPEKGDGLIIERSGLNDNWDDAEGYYSYRFGEILDGRYEVIAAHGKGVFSSVVRAKDLKAGYRDPEEVAIKIIRSNDTMYKIGLEELVILNKLVGADQEDKRHCVRFISSFKYRNHLCLVFESLHMNLREVLKKFGRNIGLKLTAVRTYAKQLLIALKHLRNCSVLHCDIKPDNMLVNDAKNVLKLCDFGNAMFAGKNEVTPYLVSRFYRAPEIILGLSYDHPMDIWSVGCCLYEIYTGKVLFPGPSNNDMLRLHMELKGPFPKKMLRKGAFVDGHFDQDLNFLAIEEDPVTKKVIKRLVLNIKPKDIGSIVLGSAGDDPKMLSNFKDLLEKIFVLDPDKRITVSHALSHPFITAMDRVRYLVEVCREDGVRLRELFLGGSFQ